MGGTGEELEEYELVAVDVLEDAALQPIRGWLATGRAQGSREYEEACSSAAWPTHAGGGCRDSTARTPAGHRRAGRWPMTELPRLPLPSRRTFLAGAGVAGLAAVTAAAPAEAGAPDLTPPAGFDFPVGGPLPFAHGVTSGDPLPDRVILWTRITVPDPAAIPSVDVAWELRSDPQMTAPVVASGTVTTDASRDYTVKVDAPGLAPGTTYYYRFSALGRTSLTGRTRTAVSEVVHEVRFAAISCASYWSVVRWDGMRRLAERNDLDLIVHMGDQIYDYPDEDEWVRARGHTDPATFDPADVDFRRWRTLAEVRRRYALYHADHDLIEMYRQHPVFVLWDNHDLSQGDDAHQVDEADVIKAFWEWTPARPPLGDGSGAFGPAQRGQVAPKVQDYVYRSLTFGPMADVRCWDVRHIATPAERAAGKLLGDTQLAWLEASMKASADAGTAWRVISNGYPFGQFQIAGPPSAAAALFPVATPAPGDYGAWDVYPDERARIVQSLRGSGITDNIIVTGDAHGNFVWDVTDDPSAAAYDKLDGRTPTGGVASVGVEIQTTSLGRGGGTETIASTGYMQTHGGMHPYGDRAGFQPYLDAAVPATAALSAALVQENSTMQYAEWDSHGYGIVHLTEEQAVLELWWQPIRTTSDTEKLGAQLTVPRGAAHATQVLQPVATSGSRVSAPAPQADAAAPADLPEAAAPALLLAGAVGAAAWVLHRRRTTTPAVER